MKKLLLLLSIFLLSVIKAHNHNEVTSEGFNRCCSPVYNIEQYMCSTQEIAEYTKTLNDISKEEIKRALSLLIDKEKGTFVDYKASNNEEDDAAVCSYSKALDIAESIVRIVRIFDMTNVRITQSLFELIPPCVTFFEKFLECIKDNHALFPQEKQEIIENIENLFLACLKKAKENYIKETV